VLGGTQKVEDAALSLVMLGLSFRPILSEAELLNGSQAGEGVRMPRRRH